MIVIIDISSRCGFQVASNVELFQKIDVIIRCHFAAFDGQQEIFNQSEVLTSPLSAPWNLKASNWNWSLFSAVRAMNLESEPVTKASTKHLQADM